MARPREILFRPADENADNWLRQQAERRNRPIVEEIRSAMSIYRDLVELAHVRAVEATPGAEQELANLERRLRDSIGRVLLPALTDVARNRFEEDRKVAFPTDRIGHVAVPLEEVPLWVIGNDQ
jgi:hypothetical protein